MKLLILGATGNTGKQVVEQALEQKHEVTVLVRQPTKLGSLARQVKVIIGNVLDKEALAKALSGNEAIISTLGVGDSFKSNNIISEAVHVLIPAMNDEGIKRLIFVSGFGVGNTLQYANFLQKFFFKYVLNDIYSDKGKADEEIRNSNLNWTLVYPVKYTNGALTGKYSAGERLTMFGFPTISRANVAHFLLAQLTDTSFLKKEVIIK